jgi:predicted Zn-dependent protease
MSEKVKNKRFLFRDLEDKFDLVASLLFFTSASCPFCSVADFTFNRFNR